MNIFARKPRARSYPHTKPTVVHVDVTPPKGHRVVMPSANLQAARAADVLARHAAFLADPTHSIEPPDREAVIAAERFAAEFMRDRIVIGGNGLSTGRVCPKPAPERLYKQAMSTLIGRLRDWRLERRISRLGGSMRAAYDAGDKIAARAIQGEWREAINARSPAQVARMDLALRKRAGLA